MHPSVISESSKLEAPIPLLSLDCISIWCPPMHRPYVLLGMVLCPLGFGSHAARLQVYRISRVSLSSRKEGLGERKTLQVDAQVNCEAVMK